DIVPAIDDEATIAHGTVGDDRVDQSCLAYADGGVVGKGRVDNEDRAGKGGVQCGPVRADITNESTVRHKDWPGLGEAVATGDGCTARSRAVGDKSAAHSAQRSAVENCSADGRLGEDARRLVDDKSTVHGVERSEDSHS